MGSEAEVRKTTRGREYDIGAEIWYICGIELREPTA